MGDLIVAAVPQFNMSDIENVATAIARGGLFGSKDPYAVLTLCLLAQAEGRHPAVVFRDYDLIQGKPSKKAKAMLADFIEGGGMVKWARLDDEVAEATFSHPQGGEVTINWNMARAAKAGLASKDMWKKYPRQMLRSRCVSEGVSTVYPGATSGLYTPEEVGDFDEAPPRRANIKPDEKMGLPPAKANPFHEETPHDAETGEVQDGPTEAEAKLLAANYRKSLAKKTTVRDIGKLEERAFDDLQLMSEQFPDLYRALVEETNAKRAAITEETTGVTGEDLPF